MNPATLIALGYTSIFKAQFLTERYLQEKGVSALRTFPLHRYSLIFGLVWCAAFIRSDDLHRLFHTPHVLLFTILLAVTWNIQQFISSFSANSINSASAFNTLQVVARLPMMLLIGALFNHDTPNLYSLLAIALLMAAFIMQPTPHSENKRDRYTWPLIIIVSLVLIQSVIDASNMGIYRQLLKELPTTTVIGAFVVATHSLSTLWTLAIPKHKNDNQILRKNWKRAALVPTFWFIATVPEAYVFAALPIYTGNAIGSVSFLLDAGSDLVHHRIHLNLRTISFILLVLIGVGLGAYSTV